MRATRLTRWLTASAAVAAAATAAVVVGVTGVARAQAAPSPQAQLALVRHATAAFHSVAAAENAGYARFLSCFDDPVAGGMGQHFLFPPQLARPLDLEHPAVLVYEPRDGTYRLVAVEYVVPGPPTMTPPSLLGQRFTYNSSLGVWKLHAWIWRPNPAGMFADFNPDVAHCPA